MLGINQSKNEIGIKKSRILIFNFKRAGTDL